LTKNAQFNSQTNLSPKHWIKRQKDHDIHKNNTSGKKDKVSERPGKDVTLFGIMFSGIIDKFPKQMITCRVTM
jgi:hypothetical protein